MALLPLFDQYPQHGQAVGRLLAGYSELEIVLLYAVQGATDQFDAPFKALYRTRGERQRILVADGLARHAFAKIGLDNDFAVAIGDMQHCRQIRNQFAHCAWYADASGYIKFVDLDEEAKSNTKFTDWATLTIRRVHLNLLTEQLGFFEYVHDQFEWLYSEALRLTKLMRPLVPARPKVRARPDRYSP